MLAHILLPLLLTPTFAQSGSSLKPTTPQASKVQATKMSRDVFEKEEDPDKQNASFSAKVKVIRQESDGVEIFFEGTKQKGGYLLLSSKKGYGKMLDALEKSRKPQGPSVSVQADPDQRILAVEIKESEGKNDGKIDFGTLPDL